MDSITSTVRVIFIREFVMFILQQCYLDDLMFQFGYYISKWSCTIGISFINYYGCGYYYYYNIHGGVVKLTMQSYTSEKTRGLSLQRFFPGRGVVSRIAGRLVDYY